MNEENMKLIRKLGKTQYVLFLRNAIGAIAFQEGKTFMKVRRTKSQLRDKIIPIGEQYCEEV